MMLFNAGLYSVLISATSGYLMPEENGEHLVYADTRILDPRYARSAEPLVCATHEERFNPIISGGGGGRGSGNIRDAPTQMIPIGCCPANDPMGKPYGAGKACCCGTVYTDDGNSFCCEANCEVYSNTLSGITKCNLATVDDTQHDDDDTYVPSSELPDDGPPDYQPQFEDYDGGCSAGWYIPSPMTAQCTDGHNEGSFCSFSCPHDMKVRIPDNPNRICQGGAWQGDIPLCCEQDGCPEDLRVDFYFILDSSSSIKDRNFHYIREYVIGLISTMPIGLDKTRVGIITYNSEVIERVRLDQFDNKEDLIDAVLNIPYEGRGTKTNMALEYAVEQGLIASKGDRPDVQNFVLVLTDGRATDDVSIGAPALRAQSFVIAIGVGKKIKESELVTIAGTKENVFMVSDFRQLGMGSLSQNREGENVSEAEQSRRNRQCLKKNIAENSNKKFIADVEESEEIQAQRAVIDQLHADYEAGIISQTEFAVQARGENIRLQNLLSQQEVWSTNQCQKVIPKNGNASTNGVNGVARFTTSYICPKSCVFEQYTLFHPAGETNY